MGVPNNTKEYIKLKRKRNGLLSYLDFIFPKKNKNPKGLIPRGYPFQDFVSVVDKEKSTLNILSTY